MELSSPILTLENKFSSIWSWTSQAQHIFTHRSFWWFVRSCDIHFAASLSSPNFPFNIWWQNSKIITRQNCKLTNSPSTVLSKVLSLKCLKFSDIFVRLKSLIRTFRKSFDIHPHALSYTCEVFPYSIIFASITTVSADVFQA